MEHLLRAFVFLLIGFAAAQQLDPNFNFASNNQFVLGRDGQRLNPNNQNDLIKQNVQQFVQPLVESLRDKCNQSGKSDLLDSIQNRIGDAMKCVMEKVNPESLSQEFVQSARTNTLDSFFNKACSIWPDVHSCINPAVSEIKQCLGKEDTDGLDLSMSMLDDTNTFFCENNADRVKRFLGNAGPQCIQENQQSISSCVNNVVKDRKPQQGRLPVAYTSSEDCADFSKVKKCIVGEMSKCQSTVPSEIADEYLALVENKVCNSGSILTWFSSLNVFLILCTYFYSMLF